MKIQTVVRNYEELQGLATEYIKDKFNLKPLVSDYFDFYVYGISKVNKDSKLYRMLIDNVDENFVVLKCYYFDCDPYEFNKYISDVLNDKKPKLKTFTPEDLTESTGSISEALGLPEGSVKFADDEDLCEHHAQEAHEAHIKSGH